MQDVEKRLRHMAGLPEDEKSVSHAENKKMAENLLDGLDRHPEFKDTLAYNILKAQIDRLVKGSS